MEQCTARLEATCRPLPPRTVGQFSKMTRTILRLTPDPIFFLHHCQIDRLWTIWQAADPEKRTLDYSGYKTQNNFNGTVPPSASLEDIMPMLGFADDVPVKDFMSTKSQYLCYRY